MSLLLNGAKILEAEARANLAKVPAMARVVYPDYVKEAEFFCARLSSLVGELEHRNEELIRDHGEVL